EAAAIRPSRGDSLGEAPGLTDHAGRGVRELTVRSLQPLLALLRNTAAAGKGDLPDSIAYRAGAVTQSRAGAAGDLSHTLHGARQHPYPIPKEGAVGRVVNVGLHHRGIHTEPAAANDPLLARNGDHAGVDLLDDLRAERQGELAKRLRVGNLLRPHPSELPIHQVRAHLA